MPKRKPKALKKPEKWPFGGAIRAMQKSTGSGRSRFNSQPAVCREAVALCSALSSTGRKKARRSCQKVHIKIKTKSKQSETFEQVRRRAAVLRSGQSVVSRCSSQSTQNA
jgi:hypothetical protein